MRGRGRRSPLRRGRLANAPSARRHEESGAVRTHRGPPPRTFGPAAIGRLSDPAKIAPPRTGSLRDSGVGRCFSTTIANGVFTWDYDEKQMTYEEDLLSGRYVITTSLDTTAASKAQVVSHYKSLQSVENRFRVMKNVLALRPIFHYTEKRVRGMSASVCSRPSSRRSRRSTSPKLTYANPTSSPST